MKKENEKEKLSKHIINDREKRCVWIATEVGFGEIIDTITIYDSERGHRRVELYATGVAKIKAMNENFVITMYLPTPRQLIKWYGSKNSVPIRLLNISKRNEKRGWVEDDF